MQVIFTRWSMNKDDRKPIAINPKRVDSLESYADVYPGIEGVMEAMPACTRVTMMNKTVFFVQGTVAEVQGALNQEEAGQ